MKQLLMSVVMMLTLAACAPGSDGGSTPPPAPKPMFSIWHEVQNGSEFDFTWGFITSPTNRLESQTETCHYYLDIVGTEQAAQMQFREGMPAESCPDYTIDLTNDGKTLTMCYESQCFQFQ